MATHFKLPEITTQSIYAGKFKDWSPEIRAAGKQMISGDSAAGCFKPTKDRPPSPEVIRKFRATVRPDAGQMRVFYGRAYDPHRQWAQEMTHGINTQPSFTAGEFINPNPKSLFQQRFIDRKERVYSSHVHGPLGRTHTPDLPVYIHPYQFTFGVPTELDSGAGGLINPNKNYAEVDIETQEGHELYVRSHKDFNVGEQMHRSYTSPNFSFNSKFGTPTPHDNTGLHTKKTLKWVHETQQEKSTKIVSKRVDDFREKSQSQLGQVHDPIKDTLRVPPDHSFGILIKPDEYGAGDLLHMRPPGQYLRGRDRQRGVLAATRQHLKKANYHNFNNLVEAFKFYDKDNTGTIDVKKLHEACTKFQLPVEPELLVQLMDYCDANRDGQIDYLRFANFLNWKDKMPSGLPPKSDRGDVVKDSPKLDTTLVKSEDLQPKSPQSAESTPRRLKKQIDSAIGDHKTSASMINAVVGGIPTKDYRTYGTPTIRSDLSAPRIRRMDDTKNYGDESDAYGLVNPSIYSQRGVYEKDFLIPRRLDEIKEIFTSIGVQMTGQTMEDLYRAAAAKHPKGHVSVESFRNILDEIQAVQVAEKTHPLAV
ncbi:hypothetical protein ACJMK2_014346 [Sinanodonta woodiana]|uniref:EF-hand domain-containing protein n=1 Tax=Sinanodonta woodiana TaxID=1069815 RepID=A0ABD3V0T6_SINWO